MNKLRTEPKINSTDETILALDVGEKRVGVAIARLDIKIPKPLLTLDNDELFNERLKALVDDNKVKQVVVGLPRGLDCQETSQTVFVRDFVKKNLSGYDVLYQDEALTSQLAEQELNRRAVDYSKRDIDALAASFILRDHLEELSN